MANVRIPLRADVADVAPAGCHTLAAEIVVGENAAYDSPVLFCFPGGGMSRRYFDLDATGYSFAEYAASHGYVVVLVDHPGVGESDVPDDGWALTPSVVARVNAVAVGRLMERLQTGSIEGLPAFEPTLALGVAHSAGSLVLIHHQSAHPQFDGLVLLGWGGHGLPEYLDANERRLAAQPETLTPRLVEGAKRRHDEPLVTMTPRRGSGIYIANSVSPRAHQALVDARSKLLAVVGYAAMIPRSGSTAAAAIDVPVFIGVGEKDLAVRHHEIPAEFPASRDVTLFVLDGAGHNHNVEPNRADLWARVLGWGRAVTSRADTSVDATASRRARLPSSSPS